MSDDDNFVRFPLALLQKLRRVSIPAAARKVLDLIIEHTYFWRDRFKSCLLPDGAMAIECDMTRQNVNKYKNQLLDWKVIKRHPTEGGLVPNPNLAEWKVPGESRNRHLKRGSVPVTETPLAGVLNSTSVSVTETQTVSVTETQKKEEKKLRIKTTSDNVVSSPPQEDENMGTEPEQPVKPKRRKRTKGDCEAIVAAMRAGLPGARGWRSKVIAPERIALINKFWEYADKSTWENEGRNYTMADFEEYLAYIREFCSWMLADRMDPRTGNTWHAKTWEFFLKPIEWDKICDGARDNKGAE